MKKFFMLMCMAILVISCTSKEKSDKELEKEKIEEVTAVAEPISPRFSPEELDSLASYAWGDLKFGISQKEARKNPIFKGGSKYGDTLTPSMDYEINLYDGLRLNGHLSIWGDFIGKGYSSLSTIRVEIGSKSFDECLLDILILINKFKETYGEPNFMTGVDMKASNFWYKRILAVSWSIVSPNNGTKDIKGYIEGVNKDYYYFKVYITNSKFEVEPLKEEIEAEQKRKDDIKKAVNNAF